MPVDEVTEEFLIESREAVDQLDRDLVLLEAAPNESSVVARIFRALHTVKGSCGFLGFNKLGQVAHAGEGLLSKIRDGKRQATPEVISALLLTVDAVRKMLESIQATEHDGDSDYAELQRQLHDLANEVEGAARTASLAISVLPRAASASAPPTTALLSLRPPSGAAPKAEAPGVVVTDVVVKVVDAPAQQAETVRVDVGLLDRLMDLAGELVLTRNQVRQVQVAIDSSALASAMQRFNLVTAGLQAGIMRMRMQPVEHLFGKFPRLVRDTAKQCGKRARVEVEGKDAELDRTLLDAIKDPLTHLIRNAVDHGIEPPSVRVERGKHPEGVVRVKAVHQSGHVAIELIDDGAGIPLDRVRQKAVSAGLISAERAAQMSDAEATSLIFLPGLSTAGNVTSVSGRGVGMDVVKTNVERLGGTVEVETALGRGTTFRLKLPLTLAIVPALIVEACGQRYAIPQVHLQELVLLDRKKQKLEMLYDAPVFRLRERLLPIVFLSETLGQATAAECLARNKSHLAVLHVNGLSFGLAVDRVIDQQEVVVKPLATQLKNLALYSACTILGDGRVVLILDVSGLAQRARIASAPKNNARLNGSADELPALMAGEQASFLLLAEAENKRLALPLARVTRVETMPITRLERAGTRLVLQHEGTIVPVARLAELLPAIVAPSAEQVSGYINVVVIEASEGQVGLLVHDVLGVVDLPRPEFSAQPDEGVLASVIAEERVTDVLCVDELLRRAAGVTQGLLRSA